MSLLKTLKDRLRQLEGRKITINAYLKHPENWSEGKQQYNHADLFLVEKDIQETEAAIAGVNNWKKNFDSRQIKL